VENQNLVDWIKSLHHQKRILEALDEHLMKLTTNFEFESQARLVFQLGLMCLTMDPSARPSMRQIGEILSGKRQLPQTEQTDSVDSITPAITLFEPSIPFPQKEKSGESAESVEGKRTISSTSTSSSSSTPKSYRSCCRNKKERVSDSRSLSPSESLRSNNDQASLTSQGSPTLIPPLDSVAGVEYIPYAVGESVGMNLFENPSTSSVQCIDSSCTNAKVTEKSSPKSSSKISKVQIPVLSGCHNIVKREERSNHGQVPSGQPSAAAGLCGTEDTSSLCNERLIHVYPEEASKVRAPCQGGDELGSLTAMKSTKDSKHGTQNTSPRSSCSACSKSSLQDPSIQQAQRVSTKQEAQDIPIGIIKIIPVGQKSEMVPAAQKVQIIPIQQQAQSTHAGQGCFQIMKDTVYKPKKGHTLTDPQATKQVVERNRDELEACHEVQASTVTPTSLHEDFCRKENECAIDVTEVISRDPAPCLLKTCLEQQEDYGGKAQSRSCGSEASDGAYSHHRSHPRVHAHDWSPKASHFKKPSKDYLPCVCDLSLPTQVSTVTTLWHSVPSSDLTYLGPNSPYSRFDGNFTLWDLRRQEEEQHMLQQDSRIPERSTFISSPPPPSFGDNI
jgi:hypothetical protein